LSWPARMGLIAGLIAVLACVFCAPTRASPRNAVLVSEFIYTNAPYPQAHASTIVQTRAGTLVAAWFGGTHERAPDVEIWFARRSAHGWSTPLSVGNGLQADGTRLPTWNPVLFQAPDGDLILFFKVGPSPSEWW